MKLKTIFLGVLAVGFSTFAMADIGQDAKEAQEKLVSAEDEIQRLYRNGSLTFENKDVENSFLKAMMSLQRASTLVDQIKVESASSEKLDKVLEEAKLVHKILAGYIGVRDFNGYRLKQGAVSVQINATAVFEEIAKRNPFLGVLANGSLEINSGEGTVTEFNSLKAEFYNLLAEAAHYSKTDVRIKSLVEWGIDTKVIYPGEIFGEEIITTEQKWSLDLE